MDYVSAGGATIPKLGLGTWQNTGDSCTESVRTALDLGYRHIDTAQAYGNEEQVGTGIAQSDVDREDVFLTTKVWRSNLRADDLEDSVRESLKALDVDTVDLLLAHWPHPRVPIQETIGALEDMVAEGETRHIGVSNFTPGQLEEAIEVADEPIVCDQVLYNPYKDQSSLLETCRENDVALTAYSPLGRGDAVSDDVLAEIGERYDKSAAQVALRWLVQQDGVVAIPKATSRNHIEANLAVFDFELTEAEMQTVADRSGGVSAWVRNRLPGLMRRFPI